MSSSYVMCLDRLAASVHANRDTPGHLPAEDNEEAEHEGTSRAAQQRGPRHGLAAEAAKHSESQR